MADQPVLAARRFGRAHPVRSAGRSGPGVLDAVLIFGLAGLLGALMVTCSLLALPLLCLGPLPPDTRRRCSRWAIMSALRACAGVLTATGAYRLDLSALDALREGPPVILAPNHPTLIDALLILSRRPDVTCVLKPPLTRNPLLALGAHLAGYSPAQPPLATIRRAVADLQCGGTLLLFPEGTRSGRAPVNPLKAGIAVIARRAAVPVPGLLGEAEAPSLSKGWRILRPARLPIRYRIRLGARLAPPTDDAQFMAALHREFERELAQAPQSRWLAPAPPDAP